MTKKTIKLKKWKLCKTGGGCSKPSPDDELLHAVKWTVKKAA